MSGRYGHKILRNWLRTGTGLITVVPRSQRKRPSPLNVAKVVCRNRPEYLVIPLTSSC